VRLPPYPRYKPSGVEWFGDAPEHWDVKKMTYGFSTIGSGTTPKSDSGEFYEGDIPWVTTSELRETVITTTKQNVTRAALSEHSALRLYPVGTLLFAMYGATIGRLGILGVPATLNQACCAFTTPRLFDTKFVFYWLWMRRPTLISMSSGGGQPNLSQNDLRQIRIPTPPLSEQRAIAEYLDRETGRIDLLLTQKQELIERLVEKRTALISHIVTRGLPPIVARASSLPENPTLKPSGLAWLDDIPAHWDVSPIKSLAKSRRKTFTDGDWVELPFITNEGVRLIQTGNVGVGIYKEQGFRYISNESFTELNCTEIAPNDVLICRLDGPVGRACLTPNLSGRMITSVDNTILKVRDAVSPHFVVYLLSSAPWLAWIDALCRVGGGFRMRISRTMLGNIRVPLPPFQEQVAIATYLDSETAKLDALVAKIKEAIERVQEYRTALITAAVTGKIDVRKAAA
jgi:type I restriction enzyme, S subunit